MSPMLYFVTRRLVEAALDQPTPTPALVQALNEVLETIKHPSAPQAPKLPNLPIG